MKMLALAWKNIFNRPLNSALTIFVFSSSIIVIILLSLVQHQLSEKFENSRRHVHMVVGAPGSKTQLILSSIYHMGAPTGNVKIKDVTFLLNNKDISAIPLALGDHYAHPVEKGEEQNRRIVGTDTSYLSLYNAKIAEGKIFENDMEVTIGQEVAQLGLKIGDTFKGVHGLGEEKEEDAHVHEQIYTVVGILKPTNTVLDQLILCNVQSVWAVHHGSEEETYTERKEIEPTYEFENLTVQQIDSLKQIIKTKTENISRFIDRDEFYLDSIKSDSAGLRLDMIRIKSNAVAIQQAINLLRYYNVEFEEEIEATKITNLSVRRIQGAYYSLFKFNNENERKLENIDAFSEQIFSNAKELELYADKIIFNLKEIKFEPIRERRRKRLKKLKQHPLSKYKEKELTALLVRFKGSGGILLNGRIEEIPHLTSAMVELETQNLYELIAPAVSYLELLAYFIVFISAFAVFFSLIKSLRERKYEIALLRVMGATRIKLFSMIIIEGIVLSILGFIFAFIISHLIGEVMAGYFEQQYHYSFTGFIILPIEKTLLIGSIGMGFVSALIPAFMAMNTNISKTLSDK